MPQEALPVFPGAMSGAEHQQVIIIIMHKRQVKNALPFLWKCEKSADTAASTTKL